MTSLTSDDVIHVAKLAKLKLSSKDLDKFKNQLSNVLNYFDELNEVDTKDVEPTSQTTGLTNVLRVDEVKSNQYLSIEEALSGTDNTRNGFFEVPVILNKEERVKILERHLENDIDNS